MADIIDIANDAADLFLSEALKKRQHDAILPTTGTGSCLHCDEVLLETTRRWCGVECRDAWQKDRA